MGPIFHSRGAWSVKKELPRGRPWEVEAVRGQCREDGQLRSDGAPRRAVQLRRGED